MNGQVIGKVFDFDPMKWYGKVELASMPEMSEYGTLNSNCTVDVDGKEYTDPR